MSLLSPFFCSAAINLLCQSRLGFPQRFLLFFWLLPHACKCLFDSIYNHKWMTMFHQNLAPQKSGIHFQMTPDVKFVFLDLGYNASSAITGHGISHTAVSFRAQYRNPLIRGGPQLYASDCRGGVHRILVLSTEPFPLPSPCLRCFTGLVLPTADFTGHDWAFYLG